MIRAIYIFILSYFLLGAVGFYFINRKKSREKARENQIKLLTYFIIINILFFSIVIHKEIFRWITVVIILPGIFEMVRLFRRSGYCHRTFFSFSLILMLLLSAGFYFFSGLDKGLILYSFLIISIFDSFSQITGQLWGRKKILPSVSPNKTLGGVTGGALTALGSSFLLHSLFEGLAAEKIVLTTGLLLFAFLGDIAASYYKRKYGVKDFSALIPGHGGILDRFDSLLAGGAWAALFVNLLNF